MIQSIPIVLDNESISNILGSISLYCWIVVFLPQIYENYSRGSSEGLSIEFIIIWLIGDIFNVLGSVLQRLIFTAILLAVYYTIADIILLIQCLKYGNHSMDIYKSSPTSPFNEKMKILMIRIFGGYEPVDNTEIQPLLSNTTKTTLQKENIIVKRIKEMLIVCAVIIIGILSWYITYISKPDNHKTPLNDRLKFNITAQFFGYISAVFYLASRLPQIFLNIKNKSTDGISFLFFLLACLGNITFVLSVLSISLDKKYILVNLSWLIGSSGTLFMDFMILCQFFYYGEKKDELLNEVEV
ncbi:related to Ypq1p [Hanseniaspora guilliermondii]|uniref:Related to Ypq1p n=1 Tax=Hanseniaspora guilliermondii TaxID=56406 RepID=A0A1L0AUT5_9ASCO|nr:related to Ypq1p [Hanseniaspora guilliermondii]